MIKKNLILGLIVFGLVACATISVNSNEKAKDNNKIIEDINSTKKVITIDLDKELKKDYSKGSLRGDSEKIIPIFIDNKGDNDEVVLQGEVLKRANKIKIGENDEVALSGEEYTIRTSELKFGLKDDDNILIKDKNGTTIIKMKVRAF
jgi:hypothetical protein